ncbi:MAG TPA: hypothetical protein VFP93_00410, partial [Gammaproteobacteria bacterium]|nr:hypothetical protein [Gammaproteobacteria bacterium]
LHVDRSQNLRAQPVTVIEETHETIVEIRPRVRYLPPTKAIPTIPYNVIGPFLSRSQVMPEGILDSATAIVAVDEDHLLVGEGNRFFTPLITVPVGGQVSLFRSGSLLTHPDTEEILGQVAFYLGSAEVESHSMTTSLIVQKSREEMRPGDRLCPIEEEIIEPYFFPKMPQGFAYGYILSVFGGVNQIGQNQVVVISGGYDSMREIGDVLAIYQTKEDLPPRLRKKENFYAYMCGETTDLQFAPILVGRLIIFRVFDKTSLGLIVSATRPIYLQDVVMSP